MSETVSEPNVAKEYERVPSRIMAVEFQPDRKPWPLNVRQRSRETCSDPQCGDSTWDHMCDLGEPIDEWFVYNPLHKSTINLNPGDMVRVDDPNDTYPIDRAKFKETYREPGHFPADDKLRSADNCQVCNRPLPVGREFSLCGYCSQALSDFVAQQNKKASTDAN